ARVGGEPRWAAIALTGARAGLPLAGLVGLADLEHGDVGLLAPHVDRDGGEHALQRMAAEERRVLAQRVDQAEPLGGAGRLKACVIASARPAPTSARRTVSAWRRLAGCLTTSTALAGSVDGSLS